MRTKASIDGKLKKKKVILYLRIKFENIVFSEECTSHLRRAKLAI